MNPVQQIILEEWRMACKEALRGAGEDDQRKDPSDMTDEELSDCIEASL